MQEDINSSLIEAVPSLKYLTIDIDKTQNLDRVSNSYDMFIIDSLKSDGVVDRVKRISRKIPILNFSNSSAFELEKLIESALLSFGNPIVNLPYRFSYNKSKRVLFKESQKVKLSKKELALIHLLILNIDRTISMSDIESYVWNGERVRPDSLRSLIRRVRVKTSADLISNIVGHGYRVESRI